MTKAGNSRAIAFGSTLILFAGAFLLEDAVSGFPSPWTLLPAFLIFFGLVAVATTTNWSPSKLRKTTPVLGSLIILLIAYLAFVANPQLPLSVLPVIGIGIGVLVLIWALTQSRRPSVVSENAGGSNDGGISSLLGSNTKAVSGNLSGALTASAVLGSWVIDLRAAQVSQPPAVIDLTVLFGSGEILIPQSWGISNNADVILGSVVDRTSIAAQSPMIELTGNIMFGSVEIKR